jgi:hypothetical protein
MFVAFKVCTVLVVAVAFALPLAHALEWPGKMRLSRRQYLDMQPIYYPGFTIGGVAEPIGAVMVLALLILSPPTGAVFWLTFFALLSLVAMHATYWLMTHPVNNFWLEGFELKGLGLRFFDIGSRNQGGESPKPEWTAMRDRWEMSHLIRSVFGVVALTLLVAAMVI